MNTTDPYAEELLRAILLLKDYLRDVVLIGGCVPYIFTRYLFEDVSTREPVLTTDLDILVRNQVAVSGSSIPALMIGAGYAGRAYKERHTQYFKFDSRAGTGFEIEFLTPSPIEACGQTTIVQPGLRAQVIPGLQVMLEHNTEVPVRDVVDGIAVDLTVRVPTPGAFVLNKMQTYLEPSSERNESKDVYYIYYVLRNLPLTRREIADDVKRCDDEEAAAIFATRLLPLFVDEHASGTLQVAAQLGGIEMTERNTRLLVL